MINPDTFNCKDGDLVKLKLAGDDYIFTGEVIKAKKLWVQLDDYYGGDFIADENNIKEIGFINKIDDLLSKNSNLNHAVSILIKGLKECEDYYANRALREWDKLREVDGWYD